MSVETEQRMYLKQQLLMVPSVKEFSPIHQGLLKELKEKMRKNSWYRTAGFHPDVNAQLIGYCIRSGPNRYSNAVFPVYKTDNGIFAVDLQKDSVTSWSVELSKVFTE
jgi:hypothetical protein